MATLYALAFVCIVLLLAGAVSVSAQPGPIPQGSKEVRLKIITSGLAGDVGGEFQITPTEVVPDGTGRLFVATLGGPVRVIDSAGNLLPVPFLTAAQTGNVPHVNSENGMLSLVFHPDFATAGAPGFGKLYTQITEPGSGLITTDFGFGSDHHDVITEWTVNDIGANVFSGTLTEILRVAQPNLVHNISDMYFGLDKTMFINSGDGGVQPGWLDDPQEADNIYGKILRIDPVSRPGDTRPTGGQNNQYRIPADNLFSGDGDPNTLDEIFAVGFRSPYRGSIDRATGEVYVGNVGQMHREEIEKVSLGSNHEWGRNEGTRLFNAGVSLMDGTTPTGPLFEYDHSEGFAVIGGFVYRGSLLPALVGKYVFAEFGQNLPSRLFYGDPATGRFWDFLIDPDGDRFGDRLESLPVNIISIGEDSNGELYLAAVGRDPRSGGGVDGMIIGLVSGADFDGNGVVDAADIDLLCAELGGSNADFDLTGDGMVNSEDADKLILNIFGTEYGDADLMNGSTLGDLGTLASNYASTRTDLGWADGDFNWDGQVSLADLGILAANYADEAPISQSEFGQAVVDLFGVPRSHLVPEPSTWGVLVICSLAVLRRSRSPDFSGLIRRRRFSA